MIPTADLVRDLVASAVLRAGDELAWTDEARAVAVEVEHPSNPAHGDYASNIAMRLARIVRRPPAEIARAIAERVRTDDLVAAAEAAGGFVNMRLRADWVARQVAVIAEEGTSFGRTDALAGERIQVEYISANPTGPVTVANARGGPLGDVLANVLAFHGADVTREYYINDAGSQMDVFGRSVAVRYLELGGATGLTIPEDGYPAEYIVDLAREIRDMDGAAHDGRTPDELAPVFAKKALERVIEWHRRAVERFGMRFDTWYRETALMESGYLDATLEELRARGQIEDRDGAIWLRSRELGEDIDSVIVRSNGVPTYFGVDVAYHREALVERGFDRKIDIWGANTHGHMRRMRTAMAALDLADRWDVVIYQFVRFLHEGAIVNMARRRGQFLLLEDVIDAVGVDAARWFLLQSSADRTLDFDFALAVQQSNENPVFYVQYAHARIASICRTAAERGISSADADVSLLVDPAEQALIKKCLEFPELVSEIRTTKAVHRLTGYALELAGMFHGFYRDVRVVTDDVARSRARLRLVEAAQVAFRQVLGLLGVRAPESM